MPARTPPKRMQVLMSKAWAYGWRQRLAQLVGVVWLLDRDEWSVANFSSRAA